MPRRDGSTFDRPRGSGTRTSEPTASGSRPCARHGAQPSGSAAEGDHPGRRAPPDRRRPRGGRRGHGGAPLLRARGAPGAGKTTRVPPALAAAGMGAVWCLEPRRIAARAAARRVAAELGCRVWGARRPSRALRPEARPGDRGRLLHRGHPPGPPPGGPVPRGDRGHRLRRVPRAQPRRRPRPRHGAADPGRGAR